MHILHRPVYASTWQWASCDPRLPLCSWQDCPLLIRLFWVQGEDRWSGQRQWFFWRFSLFTSFNLHFWLIFTSFQFDWLEIPTHVSSPSSGQRVKVFICVLQFGWSRMRFSASSPSRGEPKEAPVWTHNCDCRILQWTYSRPLADKDGS